MFPRLLFSLLLLLAFFQSAALGQVYISELQPGQYFDFWVGSWELSWKAGDGSIETGTNTIEKILDGNVLLENFEATSGSMQGYEGKSFSVYEVNSKTWKQTWVDDTPDYITFTGRIEGNKRMFVTSSSNEQGDTVLRRMVFYDITENSFTWDWESSEDNGQSWQLNWRIGYKRADS